MIRTRVIATAASAPKQVITNDDMAKIVDTSDEWITQRTGIKQRHISAGENTSVLVSDVAKQLLDRASVAAEDIDLIIVASVTPDYGTPSLACMVQKEIGAVNAVAFDVVAACSGFMFALSTADKYIRTGAYKNAIVIGGETLSKIVDWTDRSTCVLFGDGAGGAYVESSAEGGVIREDIGSAGDQYEILTEGYTACSNAFNDVPDQTDPEWYVHMDGRAVFKFATKKVMKSLQKVMEEEGITQEDVKFFVPHQANMRILEVVSKKLDIPFEKFYLNMDKYGNTSSASIPMALNELNEKGLLERGDKIILSGFGGGMTWGTMLIVW
ncbi:MAG: beta-ketoacyl-ACP synthase III [Butyribacter sp.]|nr:ketoacyl-ACP synthase III [bacterium]MDY3853612.1 beta-ketoacyl-ACP synthase III [Butyribacter sp.]